MDVKMQDIVKVVKKDIKDNLNDLKLKLKKHQKYYICSEHVAFDDNIVLCGWVVGDGFVASSYIFGKIEMTLENLMLINEINLETNIYKLIVDTDQDNLLTTRFTEYLYIEDEAYGIVSNGLEVIYNFLKNDKFKELLKNTKLIGQ